LDKKRIKGGLTLVILKKATQTVWISLGLFIGTLLWDVLVEYRNLDFLLPIFIIPFLYSKLVAIALSVYVLIKTIKHVKSYLILTILTITLCMLALLNPFNEYIKDYIFKSSLSDRMEVVQLIHENKLTREPDEYFQMPRKYRKLGDRIIPMGNHNLYFLNGAWMGYYYSASGSYPLKSDFDEIRGDLTSISVEKKTDHWYYVECYYPL
jgi:hypothetical protein